MDRVVKQRGPIPSELWGADSLRLEVARQVAAIVKSTIGWTADYFLPDDPVAILLWGGWYDLSEVEAVMTIEEQFVVDIPVAGLGGIGSDGMTLGQLVDYVLANAACVAAWPRGGDESLESRACPKRAAFFDLRKFIQRHCHAAGVRFRPSTDLRETLPSVDWQRLNRFLQARFGVRGLIRKRFLGTVSPRWAWLTGSTLVCLIVGRTLQWQPVGWLLGSLLGSIVLGILVARLSRLAWRRGTSTAREVVMWILQQRAKAVPPASPSCTACRDAVG